MDKRLNPNAPIVSALLMSALTLTAAALPPAHASDLSVAEQCDKEAGSELDLERNMSFPPVATQDIRIGIALSACREAYNQSGSPRIQFQLARVLDRAGERLKSHGIIEEAARNGHALAMVHYGALLAERGEEKEAFDFYRRAAETGNALAAHNLGIAYRDGIGTAPHGELSARWLAHAAQLGEAGERSRTLEAAALATENRIE
ncbi:hypothetical protein J2Z31_002282 [Sinorhizobium kostiense]|uniref:Sel1 repeat family protein n=1 Tax=Sinorhizobium kostiense TaxID=76747 RepID=A0ABS4QYS7_9HYPH|nr:hypothetical protein [Sinorhizobium kostiense]